MTERFSLSLTVEGDGQGGLAVAIRPLNHTIALSADSATLLMTAWREADSVVRARLEHVGSGLTSYLQGNDSLFALGEKIGLTASPKPRLE